MLVAIVVFLLAVGLILGGYAAVAYLPGAIESRQLARRLRDVGERADATATSSVVLQQAEGPLPAFDRLLAGTGAGWHLTRLISQSGVQTTPSAFLLMSVISAVVAAVASNLLFRHPLALALAAPLGGALPLLVLLQRRGSRLRKFEEDFPEALDLLSRALRAGHAFQTGLGMVAEEMRAPVGPEFKRLFEEQNFGLPLRDAMLALTQRVPLVDVSFFATAVAIQRETGGNLAEILDNLAHVVRERFKILRQVRVHSAHGRITGFVLLALPAFLAVALSLINADHMQLLFREELGRTMLMGVIVMQIAGFIWIRRVVKIEV